MKGVFELRDWRDLYQKLERDQAALADDPRNSDLAFNFFVTAWHLLEWVYPDDKKKRNQVRQDSHLLRICQHIANSAKHYEATNQRHRSVEDSYRDREWPARLLESGQVHLAIHMDRLMVRLHPAELKHFNGRAEVPAAGLAAMVVDFWREHIEPLAGD